MSEASNASWRGYPFGVVGAVILLSIYWAAYALAAPVTVWDSNVYNLARLLIAERGGLFGNDAWNSERQVCFPWGFDAIHYPFLRLSGGWGVALPSFACFVGLAIIVFRVARAQRGRNTAWWCVLTLFSLPMLMYQASSTKNDLAVVFGVACWYYAFWLWRRTPQRVMLWWMALALGFAAGAKSSGVPLAVILGAFTAWQIRASKSRMFEFSAALLAAAILCGSVETYLNNKRTYDHWLGPVSVVEDHRNRDGWRGATANFIRYVVANQTVGVDLANPGTPVAPALSAVAATILTSTGLKDVGYRSDYNDRNLPIWKHNTEASGDFGPVGGISLLFALTALLVLPMTTTAWRLSALALANLALVSATIAWMPWNSRFLMLTFILCSLALTLQVLDWSRSRRMLSVGWFVILVLCATAYPLYSYNKRPTDLSNAFRHRQRLSLRECPGMAEIIEALARLAPSGQQPPTVLISAGADSWMLPLLQIKSIAAVPKPRLAAADLAVGSNGSTTPRYVLALNQTLDPSVLPQLELLQTFKENKTGLYRVRVMSAPAPEESKR